MGEGVLVEVVLGVEDMQHFKLEVFLKIQTAGYANTCRAVSKMESILTS